MKEIDYRMFPLPPTPPPTMPAGLVQLMEGLSRDVIKNNPSDLYQFCADHMKNLLELRGVQQGRKPPVKKSLEEKIVAAQAKVRQRAEQRRAIYDRRHNVKRTANDREPSKQVEVLDSKPEAVPDEQSIKHDDADSILKANVPSTIVDIIEKEHVEDKNDSQYLEESNVINTQNEESQQEVITVSELDIPTETPSETEITQIEHNVNMSENKVSMDKDDKIETNTNDLNGEGLENDSEQAVVTSSELDNPTETALETEIPQVDQNVNSSENVEILDKDEKIDVPDELNDVSGAGNKNQSNDELINSEDQMNGSNVQKLQSDNESGDRVESEEENKNLLIKEMHSPDTADVDTKENNYESPVLHQETINATVRKDSKENSSTPDLQDTSDQPRGSAKIANVDQPGQTEEGMGSESQPNTEEVIDLAKTNPPDESINIEKCDNNEMTEVVQARDEDPSTIIEVNTEQDSSENTGDIPLNPLKELGTTKDNEQKTFLATEISETDEDETRLSNDSQTTSKDSTKTDQIENVRNDVQLPTNNSLSDTLNEESSFSDLMNEEKNVEQGSDQPMDLETAAVTIQKVFRTYLFTRGSTLEDVSNEEDTSFIMPEDLSSGEVRDGLKVEGDFTENMDTERRALGLNRIDTVLQTVNEEKSLSLSDDSSTFSSAATVIQAHVRGFLVRNRLHSHKTASTSSLINSDGHSNSLDADNEHGKNKTVLNIHIVPEDGDNFMRDESLCTSVDLPLDVSPPASMSVQTLGHDITEKRKHLKREDAFQSASPPSNNSGKSDDILSSGEHDQKFESTTTSPVKFDEPFSGETTPTKSTTTAETIIEQTKVVNIDDGGKSSSDELDVVSPFMTSEEKNINSTSADEPTRLLHSSEFHEVVLPTAVVRAEGPAVRGE